MSLFDAPEYESYIALCRELRLERTFELGDWVVYATDTTDVLAFDDNRDPNRTAEGVVWLPRLDQWLAMLEEAGVEGVVLERLGSIFFATDRTPVTHSEGYARRGNTREEAAARLWMAVTGRK